jgi:hypothetical protein
MSGLDTTYFAAYHQAFIAIREYFDESEIAGITLVYKVAGCGYQVVLQRSGPDSSPIRIDFDPALLEAFRAKLAALK